MYSPFNDKAPTYRGEVNMKPLSLLCALVAFGTALVAAWYWYDSARKKPSSCLGGKYGR
jgi:hypothetical protein